MNLLKQLEPFKKVALMKASIQFRLLLSVLFLFLLTNCNLPINQAGPREVKLNADGSGDYDSLQTAISRLPAGSTIRLGEGDFYVNQPIIIPGNLTITGVAEKT